MGLDIWLNKNKKSVEEMPSALHPEHLFKIGYFRSSYNGAGINRILKNHGVLDLYEIFDADGSFVVKPDWGESLKRCDKAINQYCEVLSGPLAGVRVSCVDHYGPDEVEQGQVSSEREALKLLEAEMFEHDGANFRSFSNVTGLFYLDGIEVLAVIPGVPEYTFSKRRPCTYVLFRYKEDKEVVTDWYLQALEIVKETIQYVLSQPDPNAFSMHWSG